MATKVSLGETALKVGIGALFTNCPNFKEELPYQVRSPVSFEAFKIFVGALEGAAPVVTTENMQDLLLLCTEFGFIGLHSQVTDFISGHSVADYEVREWMLLWRKAAGTKQCDYFSDGNDHRGRLASAMCVNRSFQDIY
jgi:hypothetical protein